MTDPTLLDANSRLLDDENDLTRALAARQEVATSLLHASLVFRRRDGSLADRAAYVASLANIRTVTSYGAELRSSRVITDAGRTLAVVEYVVTVDRVQATPDGSLAPVKGSFVNHRVWTHQDGRWQLLGWYNWRLDADT